MKKILMLLSFIFLIGCAGIQETAEYTFSGYEVHDLYGEEVAVVEYIRYTDNGVEVDLMLRSAISSTQQETLRENFTRRYNNVHKVNLIVKP